MAIHLIKLCVGADTVEDLEAWQARVIDERRAAGEPPAPYHVTRMTPSRRQELVLGGSIYWVIKRVIQVRQRIVDLDEQVGEDGVKRCALVFDPELVRTQKVRRKPFQGWRYLKPEDAPPDLETGRGGAGADLPEPVRRALLDAGAW